MGIKAYISMIYGFLVVMMIGIQIGAEVPGMDDRPRVYIGNCMCHDIEDPICCDDGSGIFKNYGNSCLAECNGISSPALESGHCQQGICIIKFNRKSSIFTDDCKCQDIQQPLCCDIGNDGRKEDFANPCIAECNGMIAPVLESGSCINGTCSSNHRCGCIPEYNPVCCNDVEYFVSLCDAKCNGIQDINKCDKGKCSSQCNCDVQGIQKICCNDKDFENKCYAKCAGYNYNQCVDGECQPKYQGIFSLNTPQQYTTLNMIIIVIQILILSGCCLVIGCILPSFCDETGEIKITNNVSYGQDL